MLNISCSAGHAELQRCLPRAAPVLNMQVFQAMGQLPQLQDLDVCSRHLHPHDLALAALQPCSSLTTLTLQLPTTFPNVTGKPCNRALHCTMASLVDCRSAAANSPVTASKVRKSW